MGGEGKQEMVPFLSVRSCLLASVVFLPLKTFIFSFMLN